MVPPGARASRRQEHLWDAYYFPNPPIFPYLTLSLRRDGPRERGDDVVRIEGALAARHASLHA